MWHRSRWGLLHVQAGALWKHSGVNEFPFLQCDKVGNMIHKDLGDLKGESVRMSIYVDGGNKQSGRAKWFYLFERESEHNQEGKEREKESMRSRLPAECGSYIGLDPRN